MLTSQRSGSIRLIDCKGRVFSAMATGPPEASVSEWDKVLKEAEQAICNSAPACAASADKEHRRGSFPAIAVSITRGPGSSIPSYRGASHRAKQALDKLLKSNAIRSIAGHQSRLFRLFAPSLAEYYRSTLDAVINRIPSLRRNFEFSDFASITVNFGPRTICKRHIDHNNLAWGWCAITALGNYDHHQGGHLVLWDLKLVIEFPPGCTILIPSAALRHSNTPIGVHETRYSITQYSGGEIFRWVYNGFKSKKDSVPTTKAQNDKIWADGIGMYVTV